MLLLRCAFRIQIPKTEKTNINPICLHSYNRTLDSSVNNADSIPSINGAYDESQGDPQFHAVATYQLRRVRVRLLHQPTVLPSTTIAAFICSIRVFDSHEDRNFQPSPKCDSQIRTNRVSPMTQKHFRQPTHRQTPRKGIRCLKCGSMDHVSIAALDCISLT